MWIGNPRCTQSHDLLDFKQQLVLMTYILDIYIMKRKFKQ